MEENKLSFSQNLLWNSAGSLVYTVCQWLLTFLVVRVSLNFENAGYLSLAISVTNIFYTITCFSVRPYLVSDIKGKYTSKEYSAFRIFTCFLSFILCAGYLCFFNYNLTQLLCILFYMLYKVGEGYVDLLHSIEQRASRMDIGAKSMILRGVFSILTFSITLFLWNDIVLSVFTMTIVSIVLILIYDFPKIKKFASITPQIKKESIVKIFFEFLPLVIGIFVNTLAATLPRQFLEGILGNESLGIYSTVATPAVIVQVFASYIFNPMQLSMAEMVNENRKKEFISLLKKTTFVVILIGIVSSIGAYLLGSWGLNFLYGSKTAEYSYLLIPMVIYTSLNAYVWFLNNVLIIFRKLKFLMVINAIGLIVSLCLSKVMIFKFGMNGVSYISILYSILLIIGMAIILFYSVNKKFENI